MIRSGEEEIRIEGFRHTTVVCELLAVVCGDCVDRNLVGIQQSKRGRADCGVRFFCPPVRGMCGAILLVNMRDIEPRKEDDGFDGAFLSP